MNINNKYTVVGKEVKMYLLPKPKSIKIKDGELYITSYHRIVLGHALLGVYNGWAFPKILKSEFEKWTGIKIDIIPGKAQKGDIFLKLSDILQEQEYRLNISEQGVEIIGRDRIAVGYGICTLCQIIRQRGNILPYLQIEDKPDILVRGYYMDQARGRSLKLEAFKKQIDTLIRYKMNHYEIYIEQSFLFQGMSEMWREDSVITAEEIMELDTYCKKRDVDLVPSIASFGHLYELLHTKTFEEICELENSSGQKFTFWDKMQHHTVDVTNEKSFQIICQMLEEFLPCFSSNYVNICADETFDLGMGKSKKEAEKIGKDRLYVEFLKKLCNFVISKGKIPMFWGDIISREPDLIYELPKETICLTWGYAADQREEECRNIAQTGANQYLCPGVCGWNRILNLYEQAYLNNKVMAEYGLKYGAKGFLNTDWGDFGHINDPSFSIPSMIYGASLSWNVKDSDNREKMNQMISKLEYCDISESFMDILEKISKQQYFHWWHAVLISEGILEEKNKEETEARKHCRYEIKRQMDELIAQRNLLEEASKVLDGCRKELYQINLYMDSDVKSIMNKVYHAIDGIDILNRIGISLVLDMEIKTGDKNQEDNIALAKELEEWYMKYKDIYRESSKESLLNRVSNVIFQYADWLRDGEIKF